MDEAITGTVFEELVKPGMNGESDGEITEVEESVDNPPLEYGAIEDSTGDASLVEDTIVVVDPLDIADEVKLATLEDMGDMVNPAADERVLRAARLLRPNANPAANYLHSTSKYCPSKAYPNQSVTDSRCQRWALYVAVARCRSATFCRSIPCKE